MANSAGICSVFKRDLMDAQHNLGTATVKFALYETTATIGPATTAYTATGEVSSAGYTAGGAACTNGTPTLDGTTAHWTPTADIAWTGVTFTTDCTLAYNDTDAGDVAIASFTFSSQTVTSGTFTLEMPVDDGTTGLIRIA